MLIILESVEVDEDILASTGSARYGKLRSLPAETSTAVRPLVYRNKPVLKAVCVGAHRSKRFGLTCQMFNPDLMNRDFTAPTAHRL